jgi:hypothetical protein
VGTQIWQEMGRVIGCAFGNPCAIFQPQLVGGHLHIKTKSGIKQENKRRGETSSPMVNILIICRKVV